jgi:hypothetical protein
MHKKLTISAKYSNLHRIGFAGLVHGNHSQGSKNSMDFIQSPGIDLPLAKEKPVNKVDRF